MDSLSWARVTVLVDEIAKRPLKGQYGLSLYIETDKWRAIFDTGQSADVLAWNASRLGIDLSKVDFVVLSHEHFDHVGGLGALQALKGVPVYLPGGSNWRLEKTVESVGLKPVRLLSGKEVAPGAFVTSQQYGPPYEHALIVNVGGLGGVLIVGCSHPRASRMAAKAAHDTGLAIRYVIGGLHLAWSPESEVRTELEALKNIGIANLVPLHCSGDKIHELAKDYGIASQRLLAGDVLAM